VLFKRAACLRWRCTHRLVRLRGWPLRMWAQGSLVPTRTMAMPTGRPRARATFPRATVPSASLASHTASASLTATGTPSKTPAFVCRHIIVLGRCHIAAAHALDGTFTPCRRRTGLKCSAEEHANATWAETDSLTDDAFGECFPGFEGNVTRHCDEHGVWSTVIGECQRTPASWSNREEDAARANKQRGTWSM